MNQLAHSLSSLIPAFPGPKIPLEFRAGKFLVKTISRREDLAAAYSLRFQAFHVEMGGEQPSSGSDTDRYDRECDHLAIFDSHSGEMIATCRLICSLFTRHFYSAQEFDCDALLNRSEVKLEIGRVCVRSDFRRGIVLMLLWRAIAAYMEKSKAKIAFGCGSVQTESPHEAVLLYRYLDAAKKVNHELAVNPREKYISSRFARLLSQADGPLTQTETAQAEKLLPALCRSYFDIGCYAAGVPAFDPEFKCIDFLTVLEIERLSAKARQRLWGT